MSSWSGLWNNEFNAPHALLSDTIKVGNSYTALAKVLANRIYSRGATRELMYQLLGVAPGQTANAQHKRVVAADDITTMLGGKRNYETFVAVNRATTSADQTRFRNSIRLPSKPASYPIDRSGNGGGSKLGW